jgi:hypothetical protein
MSVHLAPRQFIEAIDGTLASADQDHLRACDACRAEVDALKHVLCEVEGAAPMPDPSPLFWDHFGDRVRAATAATPVAGPSWWSAWWRPIVVAGAALSVAALAVVMRPVPPASAPPESVWSSSADPLPGLDSDSWDLVLGVAGNLTWDDAQSVAAPRVGVADAMIDELTPAERAAFAKLLKQEMGGLE